MPTVIEISQRFTNVGCSSASPPNLSISIKNFQVTSYCGLTDSHLGNQVLQRRKSIHFNDFQDLAPPLINQHLSPSSRERDY